MTFSNIGGLWPICFAFSIQTSLNLRSFFVDHSGRKLCDILSHSFQKCSRIVNWVVICTYELKAVTTPVKCIRGHPGDYGTQLAQDPLKVAKGTLGVLSLCWCCSHKPPLCATSELVIHRRLDWKLESLSKLIVNLVSPILTSHTWLIAGDTRYTIRGFLRGPSSNETIQNRDLLSPCTPLLLFERPSCSSCREVRF